MIPCYNAIILLAQVSGYLIRTCGRHRVWDFLSVFSAYQRSRSRCERFSLSALVRESSLPWVGGKGGIRDARNAAEERLRNWHLLASFLFQLFMENYTPLIENACYEGIASPAEHISGHHRYTV